MELNSAFAEKISVREDGGFSCKNCPNFATSVRLLARTHAQTCGSKKKKVGRKAVKISCPVCGTVCEGKKGLVKHFQVSHATSSYRCSTCLKKLKTRKNYLRHLKIHDQVPAVKCPHCRKYFKFKSYRDRHVKRVHITALRVTEQQFKGKDDGDEELVIKIDMKESLVGDNYAWQYEATFPGSDKVNRSSYKSFFNTIGLYCKEDWDAWLMMSQLFNLPLSVDGIEDEEYLLFRSLVCLASNI